MAFFFQDLFDLFWSTIPDDKKQECKTPLKLARKILPDALFIAATAGIIIMPLFHSEQEASGTHGRIWTAG